MKANQLEFSHNNNIFLEGEMICFSSVRNQCVCDDLTENAWPTKGAKWTTRINPKLTIDHCTSTHKNMGPSPLRKVKHRVGLLKATFQINSPGIWRFVSKERGGATSLCMVLT